MNRRLTAALVIFLMLESNALSEVRFFPNILYGHILTGTNTSRYETIFTVVSRTQTRATMTLFTDRGEPMKASFVDETGKAALTGASFEFFVHPDQPVRIKVELPPEEAGFGVAVKSGWATFHASEEIEVEALVRTLAIDGRIVNRFRVSAERPVEGD